MIGFFRFLLGFLLLLSTFLASAQKPSPQYAKYLAAAKSHKVDILKTKKCIDKCATNGTLVKVKSRGYGYRIDNLTHSHPYLVPNGKKVLDDIAKAFVTAAGNHFFVVTSLTRTMSNQQSLRKININATHNESTHCYGAAFDISYIRFDHQVAPNEKLEKLLENVLYQFQRKGKIYFVKERQTKCYHIVVR